MAPVKPGQPTAAGERRGCSVSRRGQCLSPNFPKDQCVTITTAFGIVSKNLTVYWHEDCNAVLQMVANDIISLRHSQGFVDLVCPESLLETLVCTYTEDSQESNTQGTELHVLPTTSFYLIHGGCRTDYCRILKVKKLRKRSSITFPSLCLSISIKVTSQTLPPLKAPLLLY